MIVRHFTNASYVNRILSDGKIELEGSNIERIIREGNGDALLPDGNTARDMWKMLKAQYKWVGRYVWFTSAHTVNSITSYQHYETVPFAFNAKQIGAIPWAELYPRIASRNSRSKKLVLVLNQAAKNAGDDVTKWYVTTKPVSLEHMLPEDAISP